MNLMHLFKLLPLIVHLIRVAEDVLTDTGQGAEKKALVVQGVKDAVKVMPGIIPGETDDKILGALQGPIESTIDRVAAAYF